MVPPLLAGAAAGAVLLREHSLRYGAWAGHPRKGARRKERTTKRIQDNNAHSSPP